VFKETEIGGVYVKSAMITAPLVVENSTFEMCSNYNLSDYEEYGGFGIYCEIDNNTQSTANVHIKGCYFETNGPIWKNKEVEDAEKEGVTSTGYTYIKSPNKWKTGEIVLKGNSQKCVFVVENCEIQYLYSVISLCNKGVLYCKDNNLGIAGAVTLGLSVDFPRTDSLVFINANSVTGNQNGTGIVVKVRQSGRLFNNVSAYLKTAINYEILDGGGNKVPGLNLHLDIDAPTFKERYYFNGLYYGDNNSKDKYLGKNATIYIGSNNNGTQIGIPCAPFSSINTAVPQLDEYIQYTDLESITFMFLNDVTEQSNNRTLPSGLTYVFTSPTEERHKYTLKKNITLNNSNVLFRNIIVEKTNGNMVGAFISNSCRFNIAGCELKINSDNNDGLFISNSDTSIYMYKVTISSDSDSLVGKTIVTKAANSENCFVTMDTVTNTKNIPYYTDSRIVAKSGNTTNRPVGSLIYVGFQYFDTSLSPARPIYASAISGDTVTWVDATGTQV
jgi:hypothetical protein